MRLCRQLAMLVFKSWIKNESHQGYQTIKSILDVTTADNSTGKRNKITEHIGHRSKMKKSYAEHYRDEEV